ncbi:hypothetical protein [Veillonella sp.]
MSNLDIYLYEEINEGLTYNRELEIYYDDFTYGIVTYGALKLERFKYFYNFAF